MGFGAIFKRASSAILPKCFVWRYPTSSKLVFLTFDDGPHEQNTRRLLSQLSALNVVGTFFVNGRNVAAHPEILLEIEADGHQVANHGYSHLDARHITCEENLQEARSTHNLLAQVLGHDIPKDFRPPFGHMRLSNFHALPRAGFRTVFWSLDGARWAAPLISGRGHLAEIQNGEIILFHDDDSETLEHIPQIVAFLRAKGFDFATLSPLK